MPAGGPTSTKLRPAACTLMTQLWSSALAMAIAGYLLDNVFFDYRSVASGHSRWGVLWALLLLVPAAYFLWTMLRYLGQMDELQRRIQLEACATALVGGALVAFFYGSLETAGAPHMNMSFVVPLLGGLWLLGLGLASWKYR